MEIASAVYVDATITHGKRMGITVNTVGREWMERTDRMDKYIKCSDISYHNIEFEERCHNDRWTETHEIAYRTEINRIPAADVVPVIHGKWIEKIDPWDRQHIGKCSECGKSYRDYMYFRFCPNCGAKMDEENGNNG